MNIRLLGLSIIYLHVNWSETKRKCGFWFAHTSCHVLDFNTLSIKLNAGLHACDFFVRRHKTSAPRKGSWSATFVYRHSRYDRRIVDTRYRECGTWQMNVLFLICSLIVSLLVETEDWCSEIQDKYSAKVLRLRRRCNQFYHRLGRVDHNSNKACRYVAEPINYVIPSIVVERPD